MPADDKNKKDAKGGKPGAAAAPALGPDGKPLPPVELTETQQIQLQIENQASEVNTRSLIATFDFVLLYQIDLSSFFL